MSDPSAEASQTLAAARAGSVEALGHALQACRNYLLSIAGQEFDAVLRAKGGASDLVQETFFDAQRDFAAFHGTSEKELLAWLKQILVNNAANFSRRYHYAKRAIGREVLLQGDDSSQPANALLPDPQLTPSSEAVKREQAAALERMLERLPDDYRQAIVLRYFEGRTFEEIGVLMNRTPDAARKLWSRGMERLRQEWEGSP